MTFPIEEHLGKVFIVNLGRYNYRNVRLVDGEKEFGQPGISSGFIHFADPVNPTKCMGFGGVTSVYNKLIAEGKIKMETKEKKVIEPKIFIKANQEVADEALAKAREWHGQENQTRFNDTRSTAIEAVAEYLLNEKGFTFFDSSAKYPKES